jgi:hypothetical protein
MQHRGFKRVHAASETDFSKRSSHMQRVLLGFAAAAATIAISAPASAQSLATSGFSASSAFGQAELIGAPSSDGRLVGTVRHFGGSRVDGRHFRHIHVGDGFGSGFAYAGGYYDDGDFDGNRSFDPDLWNDWWHNRPDRAFPRWVRHNQDCQRLWWSGGGWRC